MTKNGVNTGPVLIELEDEAASVATAEAPPVPDPGAVPRAPLPRTAPLRSSRLWRLAGALALALVTAWISVAAWDFAQTMLARNLWLGRLVTGALGALVLVALALSLREVLALMRLRRVNGLRRQVEAAAADGALAPARAAVSALARFYRGREDLGWGLENLRAREGELLDSDALLALAEHELMAPLDARARNEIEAAARKVALITAVVPLALADVAVALVANLAMVRRIAEIYGGRAGTLGSWRLLRTVMLHLAATGAVSLGDDLVGSLAGGGALSKLSRRFGEGVVNGALTARVGVAAIEVSRPMPFAEQPRPRVSGLVKSALTGLFGGKVNG